MRERTAAPDGAMRVVVRDLAQMFNSIDPSPFMERDLDEAAERFIVEWARDFSPRAPLQLEVQVAGTRAGSDSAAALQEAVHVHFRRRADSSRRELRELMRRGRLSLAIGLVFLSACVLAADLVAVHLPPSRLIGIVREGLTVAGWVAMWRPMEIFLYAWWPLARDRRLFERLGRMPVRARFAAA